MSDLVSVRHNITGKVTNIGSDLANSPYGKAIFTIVEEQPCVDCDIIVPGDDDAKEILEEAKPEQVEVGETVVTEEAKPTLLTTISENKQTRRK